jgi:SanA protein
MSQSVAVHRRPFKKIAVTTLVIGWMIFLALVFGCNIWIIASTRSQIFYDVSSTPFNNDGLVLGTGKLIEKGRVNQHFVQRIEAAAALYRAGKVKRLILSGDKGYDEPMEMKRALLQRGVPESALVLDNFGSRTLDSVVRARDVFKCTRLTIISERFHDFRALFLSRYFGIDAVAFAPDDLSVRWMVRPTAREYLARVKAVLDLYVLNTKPAVTTT